LFLKNIIIIFLFTAADFPADSVSAPAGQRVLSVLTLDDVIRILVDAPPTPEGHTLRGGEQVRTNGFSGGEGHRGGGRRGSHGGDHPPTTATP
jgi:hypothetical protein